MLLMRVIDAVPNSTRRKPLQPALTVLAIAPETVVLAQHCSVDNSAIRQPGILNAQTMAYRAAHGSDMTEADWCAIAGRVDASWRFRKRGVAAKLR
jgi:hypothetical protein